MRNTYLKTKFGIPGAIALAVTMFIPAGANANLIIPVQNYSFEQPDLGHNTDTAERFTTSAPTGWTCSTQFGQLCGVDDPSNNQIPGTDGPTLPGTADGAQYAYLNLSAGAPGTTGALIFSGTNLGDFVAGATYILTVAIGGRVDAGFPASLSMIGLLANGAAVGSWVSGTATAGTFADLTYTYKATNATAGEAIGIELLDTNNSIAFEQGAFDNVRLSIAPEPGSVMLSGLGGLLLVCGRLRAKRVSRN